MIETYWPTDKEDVLNDIRDSDVAEMALLYPGGDPADLIEQAIGMSCEMFSVIDKGTVVGIGGIAPSEMRPGYAVWMVGNTGMDTLRRRRKLIPAARKYLDAKLRVYHRLHNYCGPDPKLHKALRLVGFSVTETEFPDIHRLEICV